MLGLYFKGINRKRNAYLHERNNLLQMYLKTHCAKKEIKVQCTLVVQHL